MTQLNNIDNLQKIILRNKFSNFFKRVADVYHNPNSTQELVNQGIAAKISQCYETTNGFTFANRNMIAQKLSKIQFAVFFTSIRSNIQDKKLFFLLKSPKNFLDSKSTNPCDFIKYALSKYCNNTSSDKLSHLFHTTLPLKLTKTQDILRQTIFDIASKRGTLTNKLTSILFGNENKREILVAYDLKKAMQKANYVVLAEKEFDNDKIPELIIVKSVFNQYK